MDRNITLRRSAQKFVKEGAIDKAVEAYEEVVSSGETDPYDFVYAGDMYLKLGLVEEAVGHFTRGVAAYSRLGFNRNAIALCRRILRLDAARADIHRELGDLYASEELTDEALESYFTYLKSVPAEDRDDENFRQTLARAEEIAPRRASCAMRLADFLESLGHTEASADVLSRAAELARASGAEDVAAQLMERAIGLNPLLTRTSGLIETIEDRLHEVHQRKVAENRVTARESETAGGRVSARGAGVDESRVAAPEATGAAQSSWHPPTAAPNPIDGGFSRSTPGGSRSAAETAGFQEIDLTADGTRPMRAKPSRPAVAPIPIQSARHPAAEQAKSTPVEAQTIEQTTAATAPQNKAQENEVQEQEENPAVVAREAMAAGKWKTARQWIDAWLAQDPTSIDAAEALVRTAEALGDRPATIEGLTLMGDLLIQEQDLARAVPLFWRVLEIDPQNQTALRRVARFRELGLIAADSGHQHEETATPEAASAEATSAAQQGIEEAGENLEARAEQIDAEAAGELSIVAAGGSSVTATTHATQETITSPASKMPAEEIRAVYAALREGAKPSVDRGSGETHYDCGVTCMEQGSLDDALKEFAAALTQPGVDELRRTRLAELRAKCYSGLGRHREAIAELEPVVARLETSAQSAALGYFLALEHESLGELDAARQRLRGVLEADPGYEKAAQRLAQIEERAA